MENLKTIKRKRFAMRIELDVYYLTDSAFENPEDARRLIQLTINQKLGRTIQNPLAIFQIIKTKTLSKP